jgi:pimeloyl-ACP methyl ester carboxylesterase
VAGFALERRLVHARLVPTPGAPRLGLPGGEVLEVHGPGGLPVAVERHGPPDAPQVVLVHGWLCSAQVWAAQVADLGERVRLIAHDQPGHGRTPAPADGRYDLDLLGDVLAAVVADATAPGPIVLVGHSLGGMTVLNAMRRHRDVLAPRVRGVVLLSTSAHLPDSEAEHALASAALARRLVRLAAGLRGRRAVAALGRSRPITSDLGVVVMRAVGLGRRADRRALDLLARMVADAGPDPFLGLTGAVLGLDEREALAVLPPTTALVGALDRITPPSHTARMAARAPGIVAADVLPGIGHLTPLEAAEAVDAAILRRLGLGADRPAPGSA